jgi:hypothetical protein
VHSSSASLPLCLSACTRVLPLSDWKVVVAGGGAIGPPTRRARCQPSWARSADFAPLCRRLWQTFADVGCGNGFLTYLLIEEGHRGWGVDVFSRGVWNQYPAHVRACLEVCTLQPARWDTVPCPTAATMHPKILRATVNPFVRPSSPVPTPCCALSPPSVGVVRGR